MYIQLERGQRLLIPVLLIRKSTHREKRLALIHHSIHFATFRFKNEVVAASCLWCYTSTYLTWFFLDHVHINSTKNHVFHYFTKKYSFDHSYGFNYNTFGFIQLHWFIKLTWYNSYLTCCSFVGKNVLFVSEAWYSKGTRSNHILLFE